MRPLFIDTDPGVDDALALLIALAHPETEVLGISGVAGNVELEQVMLNIGKVLDVFEAPDLPIHRGADRALLGDRRDAGGFHGADGLGDRFFPPTLRTESGEHAAEAMLHFSRALPGELTLLALGPLTNVALAFALDPEMPARLDRLVVMGGTIRGQGNVTPAAEFNVWADPEAAFRVFGSGAPITLVSWETTLDHLIPWNRWNRWSAGANPRAQFVREITTRMVERERSSWPGLALPDPLAALVAVAPEAVLAADRRPVTVELNGVWSRGATIVDHRPEPKAPPGVEIVRKLDLDLMERLVKISWGD